MKFKVVDYPGKSDIDLYFSAPSKVGLNIEALSRLINHSGLSFRRVAEILGVSDLELEDTIQDLAANEDIELLQADAEGDRHADDLGA